MILNFIIHQIQKNLLYFKHKKNQEKLKSNLSQILVNELRKAMIKTMMKNERFSSLKKILKLILHQG